MGPTTDQISISLSPSFADQWSLIGSEVQIANGKTRIRTLLDNFKVSGLNARAKYGFLICFKPEGMKKSEYISATDTGETSINFTKFASERWSHYGQSDRGGNFMAVGKFQVKKGCVPLDINRWYTVIMAVFKEGAVVKTKEIKEAKFLTVAEFSNPLRIEYESKKGPGMKLFPESETIHVSLSHEVAKLWNECRDLGHDVVLTPEESKLFPYLKFTVSGLDPSAKYTFCVHFQPENVDGKETTLDDLKTDSMDFSKLPRPIWNRKGAQFGIFWKEGGVSFRNLTIALKGGDHEEEESKRDQNCVLLDINRRYHPVVTIFKNENIVKVTKILNTDFVTVANCSNSTLAELKSTKRLELAKKSENSPEAKSKTASIENLDSQPPFVHLYPAAKDVWKNCNGSVMLSSEESDFSPYLNFRVSGLIPTSEYEFGIQFKPETFDGVEKIQKVWHRFGRNTGDIWMKTNLRFDRAKIRQRGNKDQNLRKSKSCALLDMNRSYLLCVLVLQNGKFLKTVCIEKFVTVQGTSSTPCESHLIKKQPVKRKATQIEKAYESTPNPIENLSTAPRSPESKKMKTAEETFEIASSTTSSDSSVYRTGWENKRQDSDTDRSPMPLLNPLAHLNQLLPWLQNPQNSQCFPMSNLPQIPFDSNTINLPSSPLVQPPMFPQQYPMLFPPSLTDFFLRMYSLNGQPFINYPSVVTANASNPSLPETPATSDTTVSDSPDVEVNVEDDDEADISI